MISKLLPILVLGVPLISLFLTDHIFGLGFLDFTRRVLSINYSTTTKFVKENINKKIVGIDTILTFKLLVTEMFILSLTAALFNKYTQYRRKDTLDELIQVSKEALRQTDIIIEKWRQKQHGSTNAYSDDESQDVSPSKLEVPVLHIAIVDALGTRSQHERGDSGDTYSVSDSAFVFSSSLLEDDLDSNPELEENADDRTVEFKTRYLWDVMEEDFNLDE